MSNYWNQQSEVHQNHNTMHLMKDGPRPGNLLREYHAGESSPPSTPIPAAQPMSSYSPMSPSNIPPQNDRSFQQEQGVPKWATGAMQMVLHWSDKMVAQRYNGELPHPLVLRRSPVQSVGVIPPVQRPKPWKRSRTLRITRQMRQRRERWYNNSFHAQKLLKTLAISFALFLVGLISSTATYGYGYYESQLPRLQGIASMHIEQTTRIYDRNGILLKDLYNQNGRRTPVSYDVIPQVMKDAMVAAEDKTFWNNGGIDPQGILRAASDFAQSGSVQGGGSTITQQLIKNLIVGNETSIARKLPEASLAVGLTQQYPKWKILEMYFNVSPFGSLDLGVEAAAQDYFHLKPICDHNFKCIPAISQLDYDQNTGKHDPVLALARASLLAGMPQNPVNFDPTGGSDHLKQALERQDYVLSQMLSLNMPLKDGTPITLAVIQQAEQMTAKMKFTPYKSTIRVPHFVEWVTEQLADVLGNGNREAGTVALLTGGFNIRTTIDVNLEDYVERAVKRHLEQPEYQPFPSAHYAQLNVDNNVNDAAVVVMNAKTGEVLAMDGSADYNSQDEKVGGQVNAAVSARPPGSTMKPIVYTTAFQMGWHPGIVLPDTKTYFYNDKGVDIQNAWTPSDYGGEGHYNNLNWDVRKATANSFNIPAVKALKFAGVDNVVNMAQRMGITVFDKYITQCKQQKKSLDACIGPSLALGAYDIPLTQMVGAYQVFANQGVRVQQQSILDVWDNYGHNLYHYNPARPKGIRVLSAQLAYIMTSVLTDEHSRAYEFLNDHDLSFWDWDSTCTTTSDCQYHQVAAKTGTTDSFRDNWTVGYTPDVVVGVWAGNANNEEMNNVVGITGAAPIWHSVIERVSGHCNVAIDTVDCGNFDTKAYTFNQGTFIVPDSIHKGSTSAYDGLRGSGTYDWILDGQDPSQFGVFQK